MAGLSVEFPASCDPVSLAQAKNYLRVDDITDDDALITGLISAATEACENFTRRSFIQKGFLQTLDAFPYFTDTMLSQLAYPPSYYALPKYSTTLWNYSQMIKLFRPPLISVDRITYAAALPNGTFQDMIPQPPVWYPQTEYEAGDEVVDYNGNIQSLVGSPGTTLISGIAPPDFSDELDGITDESAPATAVWLNEGPSPYGEWGNYIVDNVSEPARVFPGIATKGPTAGFWPAVLYIPNAVQIHFTAGYGPTPADVPQGIQIAILRMVADLYENRTPVLKDSEELVPRSVRALLWKYRVLDLAPTRG
jgi:hypothetical protein